MNRPIQNLILFSAAGLCMIMVMFIASSNMLNAKPGKFPVEAGPAKFLRDHDTAIKQAKESGKPVFAFFQEVPG